VISQPKGTAADLTSSADFFTTTQRLLREARDERSEIKLRRADIRMDMDKFRVLPAEAQEDLRALRMEAFRALGWGAA
jgi:hypothetical protein